MYKMHLIEEIEGIGKNYQAQFNEIGLKYTEDLLYHKIEFVKSKLKDVTLKNKLYDFIFQSILMQVTDSGQYAEALYKNKLRTLNVLAWHKPEKIIEALEAGILQNLLNNSVDLKTAIQWQKLAVRYMYTGIICGKVLDSEVPIQDAKVYWKRGDISVTAEDGSFWLPGIPFGNQKIVVDAKGFEIKTLKLKVVPNQLVKYKIPMKKEIGEVVAKPVHSFNYNDYIEEKPIALEDISSNQQFYVSYVYKNGDVKLNSIERWRFRNRIEILSLRLSPSELNLSTIPGVTYEWTGTSFRPLNLKVIELRANLNIK